MKERRKQILVITGSVRPKNYTMKAVRVLEEELKKNRELTYEIVNAADLTLHLPGTSFQNSSHEALQKKVLEATGLILASPEYHGGISSVMKLIIDNLGFPSVLAGKPIAFLGVAAGSIGAVKSLEQLRSICSHVGAFVLPRPISIAHVQEVFDEEGKCLDTHVENQIRGVVTLLTDYIDRHICPGLAFENVVREE